MATKTRRTQQPARADGCRCRPLTLGGYTQPWPVLFCRHLGEARYLITRRHHAGECGLPAENVNEEEIR